MKAATRTATQELDGRFRRTHGLGRAHANEGVAAQMSALDAHAVHGVLQSQNTVDGSTLGQ